MRTLQQTSLIVLFALSLVACGGRHALTTPEGDSDEPTPAIKDPEPKPAADPASDVPTPVIKPTAISGADGFLPTPYVLEFRFSQKCIEMDGGRVDQDARAIQMPCNQADVQRFRIVKAEGGYLLQNIQTAQCLIPYGLGVVNGTPINSAPCFQSDAQLFEVRKDEGDTYFIKNLTSKRCLQIETNQPTDRLGVELFDCLQNSAQKIGLKSVAP